MRDYIEGYCEGLDASVFSGDFMEEEEGREEFRFYLKRWQRQLDSYPLPEGPKGKEGE